MAVTYTKVHGTPYWSNSNTSGAALSLTVSPTNIGDIMIACVLNQGGTSVASLSGGGVTTWSRVGTPWVDPETTPSTMEWWIGTVTATGSSSISVTWNAAVGSHFNEITVQDFHATGGTGTWLAEANGNISNASSGTVTYPALAATNSPEVYVGYASTPSAISTGSPSPAGFVQGLTNGNNCMISGGTYVSGSPSHSVSLSEASWAVGITVYQPAAPVPANPQEPATPPGRRSPMSRLVVPDAQPQLNVPLTITNNAAGGTNGVQTSVANSGGASGTPWDSTTVAGTGAVFQADSTHVPPGHPSALSYQVATGATAVQCYTVWAAATGGNSMAGGNWSPMWFRFYLYATVLPSGVNNRVLAPFDPTGGSICGALRHNQTTGFLSATNNANGQVGVGALAVPLNAWCRIEGYFTPGGGGGPAAAAAGYAHVDLYTTSIEGTTPDDSFTTSLSNFGASFGQARWGQSAGAQSNYGPYWYSDLAISNVGPIGPVGTVSTPVTLTDAAAATEDIDQPLAQLQDAFPGSSVDATKWTAYGTTSVSGGTLTVTDTANSTAYSGIKSNTLYDLTGSYLLAHCTNGGNQYASTQAMIMTTLDASNSLALIINNGNLIAQSQVAGSYVTQGSITWVGATMSWLRIRESGGTLFWDYSADGISWSNLASLAKPGTWDITVVQAVVQEGAYTTSDPQAASQWQSVNLPPSAVPQADVAGASEQLAVQAAVPVADTGAGADVLAVPAETIPLADAAGAAEQLAVTATVPVAERAAGVESVSVSAAVPLAEVGSAAETAAVAATVPLADVAAGADALPQPPVGVSPPDAAGSVDQVTATVTAGSAETGAAIESLTVAVTLAVADVSAGTDQLSASVAVPLADSGAGADGVATSATVPLADQAGASEAQPRMLIEAAGAADSFSATMAISFADAAGSVDQQASPAAVPLPDAAGGIDSQVVAAAVSLPDAGGASDQPLVSAATPLADAAAAAESQLIGVAPVEAAAAADALAVSATAAVADVAGGSDTFSSVQGTNIQLADAAAATESSAAAASVPVPEAAGSTDLVAASATVPLPEQAGAADAISVVAGANPQLPDAAGSTDRLAATVTVPLGDSAAGADSVGLSASALLADAGAASEGWGTSANVPAADAGSAADALATLQTASPGLADAAGVREAYSAAVTTPSHDVAAASDMLVTGALQAVQLADAGAASDVLLYSVPPSEPQPLWRAAPAAWRWKLVPADPRWRVAGAGTRWETVPSPPRWEAHAMPARWVILMAEFDPIASVSQEMINVSWTSDLGGSDQDPTAAPAMPVQFAFPASSGDQNHPAAPVTWFAGTWLPDTGSYKGYIAQCSVGPTALGGLVQLTPGKYDVWSWVQTGTENPRKFAGQLAVY